MKEIELTQGKIALVDDEDFEYLNAKKWYALQRVRWRSENTWHAIREDATDIFIYMHRVIMNAPQGMEVDHIDGDGLNNQRSNLRLATRSQNGSNQMKQQGTSSQYKGVVAFKGKWQAYVHHDNRKIHLGTFVSEAHAARAYDKAAAEIFGEFARLNNV